MGNELDRRDEACAWSMFASAVLSRAIQQNDTHVNGCQAAAMIADDMMREFRKRFVEQPAPSSVKEANNAYERFHSE